MRRFVVGCLFPGLVSGRIDLMTTLADKIPAPVWQLLLMGLLGLSGVVFIPTLIRSVDAALMSTVLVAQVSVYYLALVMQFGFPWSGPAALAQSGRECGVWKSSIRFKRLLGLPVAVLFVLGYVLLEDEQAYGQSYLWVFALPLAAYALNSNWFLQARGDFKSGVFYALVGVAGSALVLGLVQFSAGVPLWLMGLFVVLVLILPQSVLGIGSWWQARVSCAEACETVDDVEPVWPILVRDAPIVLSQLLLLAATTLGTVVVSSLADAETSAAYAATEKLFNLGATVLVGLYMAVYPEFARAFSADRARFWRQTGRFLGGVVLLGLAILVVLSLLGQALLGIYLSAPLAEKVLPVLLPFGIWLMLCLSQHVLAGYFVFAARPARVLSMNGLVLAVTVVSGYGFALLSPIAWVFGMIAGQLVAVVWLVRCYRADLSAGMRKRA
jgi:O-antigen/teichoic acid export membrane protein